MYKNNNAAGRLFQFLVYLTWILAFSATCLVSARAPYGGSYDQQLAVDYSSPFASTGASGFAADFDRDTDSSSYNEMKFAAGGGGAVLGKVEPQLQFYDLDDQQEVFDLFYTQQEGRGGDATSKYSNVDFDPFEEDYTLDDDLYAHHYSDMKEFAFDEALEAHLFDAPVFSDQESDYEDMDEFEFYSSALRVPSYEAGFFSKIGNAFKKVGNSFKSVANKVKAGFQSIAKKAVGAFKEAGKKITGFVKKAGAAIKKWGPGIVVGISKGLKMVSPFLKMGANFLPAPFNIAAKGLIAGANIGMAAAAAAVQGKDVKKALINEAIDQAAGLIPGGIVLPPLVLC